MTTKQTEAEAASLEEEEKEEEGKQAEAEVEASQNGDEKADEKQEVTIGESSEDEQKDAPEKEELDKKALADKVSVLEKRYTDRDKEIESIQKQEAAILESMNPIFQRDEKLYEEWRQSVIERGVSDPGSHEQLYGSSTGEDVQQPTSQVNPNQVVSTIDQRIEDREGWKEFTHNHPEFDPKNISESEREERVKQWQDISLKAAAMKASPRYGHYTSAQLFEYAWRGLPENLDRTVKEAERVGEIKGRQGLLVEGVGSESGMTSSGNVQTTGNKVQMSKDQFATYERLKREHSDNPKIAEQFARNVQNLQ